MPSTFQPLRLAYISIVIAVHEASEAASSSCGLGPRSSPPWSAGSSAVNAWVRTFRSAVNFSPRPAVGLGVLAHRRVGARLVAQREHQRAAVVAVVVADADRSVARGLELLRRHRRDLPVALDRRAQRLAPRLVEPRDQAVGGEDGQ